MKPADDIKQLFQTADLTTHPQTHARVFEDVVEAQQETIAPSPAQPERWRLFMRHPITKCGFAALIIVGVIGLALFRDTGGVAWAIEQSIETLSKYTAIIVEGSASERAWAKDGSAELESVKMWAVADTDQTMIEKYRFERSGVPILATDGKKTWKYEPQAHRITISSSPYRASECWLGSRFLEQLKDFRDKGILTRWEQSTQGDTDTGEPRIVLTIAWQTARYNGPRSMRLAFDPKTKMLLTFSQWENADWEGPASIVMDKITYRETLPEDLFKLEIPPGATVVEE